ncbi:MAG TPA: beta-N-acetylhexosaminidase, partial [Silvibacterium sp.]|nr:beta-N-acetylhexosaminidase [Silvibacterium sp.]
MTALRKKVGQLLIVGLEGRELTSMERSWLRMIQPGGVILFRRNVEEAGQTYRLLAEASSFSTAPLFRCVDLEGGLVDRLRDVIVPMPSLAAVAASGKMSLSLIHGKLIGREAKALGFNVVLAPVLDLALPESQSVMRTRTFFARPEEVTAYADAFLSGLESAQILGCGKHFPGLGGGALDSHRATPVIERSMDDLWRNDLLPYRTLKTRLPIVMVSHASYPASGDGKPASISRYWIKEVLIKRIGHRGLVLSDDLEMGGILTQVSIEEATVQAMEAGTHLIEICKDPALVFRAYEALLSEAERSAAFRRIVESAYRKIARAKRTLDASPLNKSPSVSQIERLRL